MHPFTRRQLIAAGLGTAALGSLTACATPGTVSVNTAPTIAPATGPVRLQYWGWLKDLQKVCDVWNASHPEIQVEAVWIPGGNAGGYQKLYSALAAGGGPDLGQVEIRSVPEFMLVNGLVDLTRYGVEQYRDLYDPTLWGQVSYTGGVYGIPQDSGPMALFYQPEVFGKVGAEPPTTWDDWAAVATELRGAGSYIDCFPLADASVFAAFATQAGAQWLRPEEDGWVIDMTDDATTRVASFFDTAIDQDLVQTGYGAYSPAWFAAAAKGGIASCATGSWGDALIEGVSGGAGKWRAAPMPVWGDTGFGSSFLGGSTAAVFSSSKHPEEAIEFAVWMTTTQEGIDAMIANSGIGWSPAVGEIGTARKGPSDFFSGQNYNEDVLVPASKEQNPDWSWWPVTQQSFNILSDGFRKKASGLSLVDAVAEAEQQIITVFENKGLSIRRASA
ncbi:MULTISPECIES: ABC transporter substrate-binding protein [unclassified Rathayibacter]|jgi:multiple sugar transport system substrate-binding protein|uniref:ABC transporter substrate-binding protein n=1 Tax=unclassified Rathayibacter TaxID=2609250 RepID=UPI000CE71F75|nr:MULTISPECIES: extracellular solute-binding protein [unclassified Rathayibacter]PPF10854.1 ABC transporter substrate-binding protein [Rathayibacter sp. AY1A5]PPF19168.1 ABC transporter substrate-binding protein [Rathayibacter sp. AY1A4]PPF21923.1 ABC transporter substrate-binding protein [Rathayibacter sp. AY1A7]PPF29654.1 ABC transporter substrate-binding protein [Rathayibacter sp. AY1F2]PPF43481.1 ABC transporter substrate-binding protein [Rathayibacter sp. AY1A1]